MPLDLTRMPLFASAVRAHAHSLLKDRNVSGVAVGRKIRGGQELDELAVTVFVIKKQRGATLGWVHQIPRQLEVLGREGGHRCRRGRPLLPAGEHREDPPACPGTSIGEVSVTAGTFGAVVLQDRVHMILSNNHVLANYNQAELGLSIVQPGPFDGGLRTTTPWRCSRPSCPWSPATTWWTRRSRRPNRS